MITTVPPCRWRPITLVLCFGLCSCAPEGSSVRTKADSAPQPAPASVRLSDSLRISAASPRVALSLAPRTIADAELLVFTVADVRNPSQQSIAIEAVLRYGNGETVPLGSVALFPADQGGNFVLRIPAAARRRIAQPSTDSAAVQLVMSLLPETVPVTPDQRSLLIRNVQWQAAPQPPGADTGG